MDLENIFGLNIPGIRHARSFAVNCCQVRYDEINRQLRQGQDGEERERETNQKGGNL